jgi:hypothetical protein
MTIRNMGDETFSSGFGLQVLCAHHIGCRYLNKMLLSVRIASVLALLRDLAQPELVLRLALQYSSFAFSIALVPARDKREKFMPVLEMRHP